MSERRHCQCCIEHGGRVEHDLLSDDADQHYRPCPGVPLPPEVARVLEAAREVDARRRGLGQGDDSTIAFNVALLELRATLAALQAADA